MYFLFVSDMSPTYISLSLYCVEEGRTFVVATRNASYHVAAALTSIKATVVETSRVLSFVIQTLMR